MKGAWNPFATTSLSGTCNLIAIEWLKSIHHACSVEGGSSQSSVVKFNPLYAEFLGWTETKKNIITFCTIVQVVEFFPYVRTGLVSYRMITNDVAPGWTGHAWSQARASTTIVLSQFWLSHYQLRVQFMFMQNHDGIYQHISDFKLIKDTTDLYPSWHSCGVSVIRICKSDNCIMI